MMDLQGPTPETFLGDNVISYYTGRGSDMFSLFATCSKGKKPIISSCTNATIPGLPLSITYSVKRATAAFEAVLENMRKDTGPRQLSPAVRWSMEGNVFRLDVDMSGFPELTKAKDAADKVVLEDQKKFPYNGFSMNLKITAPRNALWPPMKLPSRDPPLPTQMGSGGGGVSRQLFSGSTTPTPTPEEGWALVQCTEKDGDLVQLGDALVVDTRNRQDVQVQLYTNKFNGNYFTTSCIVYNLITLWITVEIGEETPLRGKRSLHGERKKKKPEAVTTNVELELVTSKGGGGEEVLLLRFDADRDYGPLYQEHVDNAMLSGVPIDPAQMKQSFLVAECAGVKRGRFTVNFTASRATMDLPLRREVYQCVVDHLSSQPEELDMDGVRIGVFNQFPYMQSASQAQIDKLQLLVWECARAYLLSSAMRSPVEIFDDDETIEFE